jgi:hypothetical protein
MDADGEREALSDDDGDMLAEGLETGLIIIILSDIITVSFSEIVRFES